jgi:hypothetical protein
MDVKMIGIGFVLSVLLTSTLYYAWLRNTLYNRSTILFILLITVILSFMLAFMFSSIKTGDSNVIRLVTPDSNVLKPDALANPQKYGLPQQPQFQNVVRPQVPQVVAPQNIIRPQAPQVVPYNQPALPQPNQFNTLPQTNRFFRRY